MLPNLVSIEPTSAVTLSSTPDTLTFNDNDFDSSEAILVFTEPTEDANELSLANLVDSSANTLESKDVTSASMFNALVFNDESAFTLATVSEEILACNETSLACKDETAVPLTPSSSAILEVNEVTSEFVAVISPANAVETVPIFVFNEESPNTLEDASESISEPTKSSTLDTLVLIDASSYAASFNELIDANLTDSSSEILTSNELSANILAASSSFKPDCKFALTVVNDISASTLAASSLSILFDNIKSLVSLAPSSKETLSLIEP